MVSCVFLLAGKSSRFGGRIKGLARVGPNGETLLALSMNQARKAGIDKFIFVVSEDTVQPVKDVFGVDFDGCPIAYCFQKIPAWRKKPLGHAEALLQAKSHIDRPFIVVSSDDILGQETWNVVAEECKKSHCIPAYLLENCVPTSGKVNRAIIKHENGRLTGIEEHFAIMSSDFPSRFSGKEYAAMLMFGLKPDFLHFLEKKVEEFVSQRPASAELITSNVVNDFVQETGAFVKLVETTEIPLALTFPEDEEAMKNALSASFGSKPD